jgi:hypothetical protein
VVMLRPDGGVAPDDWNGKVSGLQAGLREIRPPVEWVLPIDANVRPAPALARSIARAADVPNRT